MVAGSGGGKGGWGQAGALHWSGRRCAATALVRPAWARSWRCKSSREPTTASEAKCNCARATERGKEAWNVTREPMDKNCI